MLHAPSLPPCPPPAPHTPQPHRLDRLCRYDIKPVTTLDEPGQHTLVVEDRMAQHQHTPKHVPMQQQQQHGPPGPHPQHPQLPGVHGAHAPLAQPPAQAPEAQHQVLAQVAGGAGQEPATTGTSKQGQSQPSWGLLDGDTGTLTLVGSRSEAGGGSSVPMAAAAAAAAGARTDTETGSGASMPQAWGDYKLYLVQEWCLASLHHAREGRTLHDPGTGMSDTLRCLSIFVDMAAGMEYLHAKGIIHGDLKPDNVMLKADEGMYIGVVAKLTDFGLSHALAPAATHVSRVGLGTFCYMAPELQQQGRLTPASDVYALGVTMWWVGDGAVVVWGSGVSVENLGVQDWSPELRV